MARDLSRMTDAEKAKLTPRELFRFNSPLPEYDYENPYDPTAHPYPRVLYGLNAAGDAVVPGTVNTSDEEAELVASGDWRHSLKEWGIITHPEAPRFTDVMGTSIPLPKVTVDAIAAKRAEIRQQVLAEEIAKGGKGRKRAGAEEPSGAPAD